MGIERVHEDINRIDAWAIENKLQLNATKTQCIIVRSGYNVDSLVTYFI